MRYLLATVVAVAWALWLGGLIALFLFVQTLFRQDRPVAVEAAPRMFAAYQMFQLAVGAVALVAVVAWRLVEPRRALTGIFSLFAVAALGAVLLSTLIMPRMEKIRAAGQSSGPEFRQLHGRSMVLYLGETAALLAAGTLLPAAMRGRREEDTRNATEATVEPAPVVAS
jgi:hypothetical protein